MMDQVEDKVAVHGSRLQKWLIFFAVCNTFFAIFGLPWSLIGLCIKFAILGLGYYSVEKRCRCGLAVFMTIKIVSIIFEIISAIFAISALALFIGLVTYENATGEITLDPGVLGLSFALTVVIAFFIVSFVILYVAFNLIVVILAAKTRKAIKKQNNNAQTNVAVPMKEMKNGDYVSVPVQNLPIAPIYLQPVVV